MAVQLNHTIVAVPDADAAANEVAELLGLPAPTHFGPFTVLQTANQVSLDFMSYDEEYEIQHYAFLATEAEFDEIFGRIEARGMDYWADPHKSQPGEINHHDGGRGVYFEGPGGHILEVITRPYGSGGG